MAKKALRWRRNFIRQWREFRDFTQESAAEALSRSPYNLDYTHASLGRIENGKQMPVIELIEALAQLYRTDIDSLLNRPPNATSPANTAKGLLHLWDQAEPDGRDLIMGVAKRVAKA